MPTEAKVIVRGNPNSPYVALTFDLGGAPGSTAVVLEILRQNSIKSTFFTTGEWAEANPALLKQIVADGHELGNHSYSHPNFTKLSEAQMLSEIKRTAEVIRRLTGISPKPYFRPPFGAYDQRLLRLLSREGYQCIYWTLDSTDWRNDSTTQSVIQRVVNNVKGGTIVINHAALEKTAQALPEIIKGIKAKGYRFGTLSQVLE
ncbi:MAG: polysaccharide deacetylase family protein [Chloroflexi bacterium]|nr:polysaccharide deacetylase family protein [Chloroflexota bacterium]MCL5075633.1 polysaccharide deacetylase family protein [Chloroflexota bacterium]